MNTLKMKVLLFLYNTHLWRSIKRAILIWMATCVTGCLILYGFGLLLFPPVESIALSLIFSSPAVLIAILFLYYLALLPPGFSRIASATGIILLTSGCINGIVSVFFNLRYFEVATTLLPFIPSALVCFLLIARKQIVSKYMC